MICFTFVSHIVLHHQAMIKITLDNQLVMVEIWGGMVRSELIKGINLFNEINVRRANQQGELRS